ncbi:MAG: MBL fold metallo-hydrolase [Bacteroidia bacterium]|nr:MBL fold metallo-hydrolase [Bacteroidia bacterium]
MVTEIEKGLYTFQVVLPDNPLKWLNCYVIKGEEGGRNLLIDSGFRRQECFESLMAGMRELELEPEQTDVFFTHMHSDHTGNGDRLAELGCRIFMGEVDYGELLASNSSDLWKIRAERMGLTGVTREIVFRNNPAIIYKSESFKAQTIDEGDILSYGGRELECVFTPGHTPGHMCLYDRKNKIMFSGDHVLFDITPNIISWLNHPDLLGTYLSSLEKIRKYDVGKTLPAHRTTGSKTLYERIDELRNHHEARLAETLQAVLENPGSCAFDLAGKMKWRIRASNWEDFPPAQKWFAVGECLAHLEYLEVRQFVRCEEGGDTVRYFYPV